MGERIDADDIAAIRRVIDRLSGAEAFMGAPPEGSMVWTASMFAALLGELEEARAENEALRAAAAVSVKFTGGVAAIPRAVLSADHHEGPLTAPGGET